MGLRWPALNLEAGTLVVREQLQRIGGELHREPTTKGGKDRTIYLTKQQTSLLATHKDRQVTEREILGESYTGGELIFVSEDGTPLESGALRRQFKRGLARAGLPAVSFHSLRHSAGSIMLANGAQLVDVSHVLGHASPAITAKIYAHSYEAGQRATVELAAKALLGGQ